MRRTLSLPFEVWDERDRQLWLAGVESADAWLDKTRAAAWAPRTKVEAMNAYGRWLQWLRETNRLNPDVDPVDRLQHDLIVCFVKSELKRVRASTLATVLFYLIGVLESFAPERDWNQLRAVHSRVKRKAGRESKKRPRI